MQILMKSPMFLYKAIKVRISDQVLSPTSMHSFRSYFFDVLSRYDLLHDYVEQTLFLALINLYLISMHWPFSTVFVDRLAKHIKKCNATIKTQVVSTYFFSCFPFLSLAYFPDYFLISKLYSSKMITDMCQKYCWCY